mmetsp:Transcript_33083/g.103573  ORF Transcript_33083/g.103573 Transcript_33083/m.103573 type:complete len:724 (-) Transcript_33083:515-2686(-)
MKLTRASRGGKLGRVGQCLDVLPAARANEVRLEVPVPGRIVPREDVHVEAGQHVRLQVDAMLLERHLYRQLLRLDVVPHLQHAEHREGLPKVARARLRMLRTPVEVIVLPHPAVAQQVHGVAPAGLLVHRQDEDVLVPQPPVVAVVLPLERDARRSRLRRPLDVAPPTVALQLQAPDLLPRRVHAGEPVAPVQAVLEAQLLLVPGARHALRKEVEGHAEDVGVPVLLRVDDLQDVVLASHETFEGHDAPVQVVRRISASPPSREGAPHAVNGGGARGGGLSLQVLSDEDVARVAELALHDHIVCVRDGGLADGKAALRLHGVHVPVVDTRDVLLDAECILDERIFGHACLEYWEGLHGQVKERVDEVPDAQGRVAGRLHPELVPEERASATLVLEGRQGRPLARRAFDVGRRRAVVALQEGEGLRVAQGASGVVRAEVRHVGSEEQRVFRAVRRLGARRQPHAQVPEREPRAAVEGEQDLPLHADVVCDRVAVDLVRGRCGMRLSIRSCARGGRTVGRVLRLAVGVERRRHPRGVAPRIPRSPRRQEGAAVRVESRRSGVVVERRDVEAVLQGVGGDVDHAAVLSGTRERPRAEASARDGLVIAPSSPDRLCEDLDDFSIHRGIAVLLQRRQWRPRHVDTHVRSRSGEQIRTSGMIEGHPAAVPCHRSALSVPASEAWQCLLRVDVAAGAVYRVDERQRHLANNRARADSMAINGERLVPDVS